MYRFLIIIFCLYLLLNPFYIFKSGLPQPADMLMALAMIFTLVSGKIAEILRFDIFKSLLRLILLVVVVNLIYFFYYSSQGVENKFLMSNLFYVFNLFVFGITLWMLSKNSSGFINIVSGLIIMSLTIQFLCGILGIGGGSLRNAIFFNNPNQLGYYVLLSLSLFTALPSRFRANRLLALGVIIMCAYLTLLSGSRAALVGVILITIILFFKEGIRLEFTTIIFLLIVIVVGAYFLGESSFVEAKLASIQERGQKHVGTSITFWQERGYDRIYLYPEFMFFGAGEGLYDRFKSYHQLEMHSGFGTMLFSYGILGFTLLMLFLKRILSKSFIMNFLLLTPVFLYNLSHQGLRDSLLWMLLASVYFVTETNLENRTVEESSS